MVKDKWILNDLFRDKDTRIANKTMEVIWKSSVDGKSDLFTGVLYNYYFPPPNYCWDILCNDEPIMDNPNLHGYNVDKIVSGFVDFARQAAKPYRTNNVAITTGMDFHYTVINYRIKSINFLVEFKSCSVILVSLHFVPQIKWIKMTYQIQSCNQLVININYSVYKTGN